MTNREQTARRKTLVSAAILLQRSADQLRTSVREVMQLMPATDDVREVVRDWTAGAEAHERLIDHLTALLATETLIPDAPPRSEQ